jgi:hypothetical protein
MKLNISKRLTASEMSATQRASSVFMEASSMEIPSTYFLNIRIRDH